MADEKPAEREYPKAWDILWGIAVAAGVLTVAFLAWDTLTDGKATEFVTRAASRLKPQLAAVVPIREEDGSEGSGSDSGHG